MTNPLVPTLDEPCFLCGAPALRRLMVNVRSTEHSHGIGPHRHGHSDSVQELRPLCGSCVAKAEAEARRLRRWVGGFFGFMLLFFLLPLVAVVATAVGLWLWLR